MDMIFMASAAKEGIEKVGRNSCQMFSHDNFTSIATVLRFIYLAMFNFEYF
jgi:hypothetical protein